MLSKTTLLSKIRNVAAACAVAFMFAPAALAQGTGGPDLGLGYATAIGLTTTDIRTTIARIIGYFLGFLGIVVVCIMLYAGFLWMTAGGNEEKVSTAKKWMLNGTIGLIIIMSAFAITRFIFRAIEEGTGAGGGAACPEGQICSGGGGFGGGGAGGFRVTGTTPAGAGPGNGGWPKNYAITVSFNAAVADASATPSSVEVRKCNARLDGGGDPQPFSLAGCTTVVAGTLTVDNNRVRFRPNATPGPEPTDFEGDFWYKIRLQGGAIRDLAGRTLLCPFQTVDISSSGAGSDYCERAVAFNNQRDVAPPTVTLGAPVSPPAYCASTAVRTAQIVATGNDDFLVAGIDFLLDGGSANLVDAIGDPASNATNAGLVNPFNADSVFVDLTSLSTGSHRVSAVAQDGVPQMSTTAESEFEVVPSHCCNGQLDTGDGETAIDCGGACHSCNGSSCTNNAQCASGFCNPATNQCEARPFIMGWSRSGGGVGTLITLTGTGFGTTPGTVTFLGNPAIDTDDVVAAACAPQGWTDTSVAVAVPAGALSGPLKLTTASGPSDRTDDGFGSSLGGFTVGGATAPGICFIDPSTGAPGSRFAINGAGFGATIGTSAAFMGSNGLTVTTCGSGETDCGWSDTRVWVNVPPIAENLYPVRLVIGGVDTNTRNFLLRNSTSSTAPRVTAVIPESGPVGSYVTIQGSGFGTAKGSVKFIFGEDETRPQDAEPICDDSWHDNYIIVKVPAQYTDSSDINVSTSGVAHAIQVVTAPPARTSNDNITFRVTNEAPRPGICSITPDNGPPGNPVIVRGEGFGAGPGDATGSPRFAVQFFKTQARRCLFSPGTSCTNLGALCSDPAHGVCVLNAVSSDGYSSWSGTQINTIVAGETVRRCSINTSVLCASAGLPCLNPADGTCIADRSGWPATGPVYVVADNRLSSNAIPFTVQDCNESSVACPVGQSCCSNGSCQTSCLPVARNSAYGWRFSTNVLPVMPKVVERAICSATSIPPVPQTPSPYKDSTDACKNAQLFFEFNRNLDATTFSQFTVRLEECGAGAEPVCTTQVGLKVPFTLADNFTCDSGEPTHCRTFQTRPEDAYNGGTHYFKKNTWYRVTLVSNVATGGLREPDGGRFLDGDDDGRQGGDYVYTFRIRNSDDPCQVSSVYVNEPIVTIEQDQTPVNFQAGLWGGNCNRLQCGATEPYGIAWSKAVGTNFLNLLAPVAAGCTEPVIGAQETNPGSPTPLTAQVTPLDDPPPGGVPTGPAKSGSSAVTVKFADPRVVAVTPKEECVQACINADIVATFNVPMDPATLNDSTVEIKRCRNASCTPPFESALGVTTDVQAIPTDGTTPPPPPLTTLHKHVSIVLGGDLQPGTFYRVWVRGGPTGVKSRSGVQLAGLNDGQSYSWKFRTKDDPTACEVARTQVMPDHALLNYVGQRQDFNVVPFGSPDECSATGQQLRATRYSWDWNFDDPAPNRVIQGFFNGFGPFGPTVAQLASPTDLVDTDPIKKEGCSSTCLLSGSQNTRPQCGNGVSGTLPDSAFEECDDGNTDDADACTNQCLLRGNLAGTGAGGCGNNTIEAASGESCDKISDGAGGFVWPNGCKQPGVHVEGFPDNLGCIYTGSATAPGSVCGDGFRSDGEACDDGNTANGDGCGANCLKEGSLRSCLDTRDQCINFCGNSRDEAGEDPMCEHTCVGGARAGEACTPATAATDCPGGGTCTGPGVAPGCNPRTCLKNGTARCLTPGAGTNCCGNNIAERGEDPACETDPQRAEFCTDRCLLKGSSPFYTEPSFCGDTVPGKGEYGACEISMLPAPVRIDQYQAIAAAPQAGFDPQTLAGSTTTVKATTSTVPDEDAGRSRVTLSCVCKAQAPGTQDAFCATFASNLACADNGCCTPRPTVLNIRPTTYNSCRNPEIAIVFSEVMNATTITANLLVGYNNGSAPCPAGSTELAYSEWAGGERLGFWTRLWNGIVAFIREYVLRPAFGVVPPAPAERYCSVDGSIVTVLDGEPGSQRSIAYFNLRRALPANKFIRVQLNPGVKTAGGVPLASDSGAANQPYRHYFGTGPTICTLDKVSVSPERVLLASVDQAATLVAHGVSASGQPIVPTIDYNWRWGWDPLSFSPPVSPMVLTARETNRTQCALPVSGTNITNGICTAAGPATCPCSLLGQTCQVASGQGVCDVTVTMPTNVADLRVRGSDEGDQPSGWKPQNTTAPVPINATAQLLDAAGAPFTVACTLGSTCTNPAGCACSLGATGGCTVPQNQITCNATTAGIGSVSSTGTALATVLLCKNPWPKYQRCHATVPNQLTIPWLTAPDNTRTCDADTWYPFFDTATNVEFYYCRDGASEGDVVTTLPCLKEAPARVINPGLDILREYLFTYETNPSNCPVKSGFALPPAVGWTDDAIGLRVSLNKSHMNVNDWYVAKGFRGNPQAITVDGYSGVKEGRTVYVNAAAKVDVGPDAGKIFTNVNTMSYSEGASAETVSIFNQLLSHTNFNRNVDLLNMGVCRNGTTRGAMAIRCNRNEDCRVNSAGVPVAGRDTYTCDVPSGFCRIGGVPAPDTVGIAVGCDADIDCQVDSLGAAIPARIPNFWCDAPKSKLIRDVRRWSDLQALRSRLIEKKEATGSFPTLQAGTFLRAQTNSKWPSWADTLAKPLGLSLPADPLNRHGACSDTGFDKETCWNDTSRQYRCPADSHVYEYRSVGGSDFQVRNDFEYTSVNGGTETWGGDTCLEMNANVAESPVALAACVGHPSGQCGGTCSEGSINSGATCFAPADCVDDPNPANLVASACLSTNGRCNYRVGKFFVGGGVNPLVGANCTGVTVGTGGVCGDGIKSDTEACEIGQTRAQSCDSDPTGSSRSGSYTQVCNNSCTAWLPAGRCGAPSTNAGAPCVVNANCTGAGAVCVNWASASCNGTADCSRCVGGTNAGAACSNNTPCTGGGVCASACSGGVCGDGIRQNPPEACDDGPLNGTYGHCNNNCTAQSQSCGDGQKQPNEACDCGALNGQYYFNGILSTGLRPGTTGPACGSGTTNIHTCAWDCQAAGPRCGDTVVNGSEECDGGFEEAKGFCNDTAQTGCESTASCPDLGTCSAGRCTLDNAKTCSTNDDCVKVCGNFCPTPEQRRRRECTPNNVTLRTDDPDYSPTPTSIACTWASWQCTAPGSCGNGVRETGEECDDGNSTQTDACIIDPSRTYMCKTARCGDGYTHAASGEECDEGVNNGRPCQPEYGLTCNYCSGACRVNTLSGGFCGDGLIQDLTWTPPPRSDQAEQCDGANGLGAQWLCVSKKQRFKSYGKYAGLAACSNGDCRRACIEPESEPCLNVPGANSDVNDTCDPGRGTGPRCHGPHGTSLAYNGPGQFLPGANMTCSSPFGGTVNCSLLAVGGFTEFDTTGLTGLGDRLYDVCDPDKDNDGVPAELDCDDLDPWRHPAYSYSGDGGPAINVPLAPEYCDGIDNDCNNIVDDDWILTARPDAGASLNFQGKVVDAFFPDQKNIVGARVIAQRKICSGDKKTACADNSTCGGSVCEPSGVCRHDNGIACDEDDDCGGTNGICGIPLGGANTKDKYDDTDVNGEFSLTGIRLQDTRTRIGDHNCNGVACCGIKLQINRFVPGENLDIPFLGSDSMRTELEERSGRGYFAQPLRIPDGASGTIYYDGAAGHEERILLVPVPRPGRAIIAFIWSGALPGYMDAELSVPGNDGGGSPVNPNPVYYSAPGTNPDAEPYARLICDAVGSGVSCGSFSTSPELMIFNWSGPSSVPHGASWKFYINDFSNVNDRDGDGVPVWRDINNKKPYVIGGFNNGVGGDPNSVAGGTLGPREAPVGYGKYWHVLNWRRCDSAVDASCQYAWNIDWPDHFDSSKPNQTGTPP